MCNDLGFINSLTSKVIVDYLLRNEFSDEFNKILVKNKLLNNLSIDLLTFNLALDKYKRNDNSLIYLGGKEELSTNGVTNILTHYVINNSQVIRVVNDKLPIDYKFNISKYDANYEECNDAVVYLPNELEVTGDIKNKFLLDYNGVDKRSTFLVSINNIKAVKSVILLFNSKRKVEDFNLDERNIVISSNSINSNLCISYSFNDAIYNKVIFDGVCGCIYDSFNNCLIDELFIDLDSYGDIYPDSSFVNTYVKRLVIKGDYNNYKEIIARFKYFGCESIVCLK